MSVEESTQNHVESGTCVNLEAVNRISKLPIVESTIETATNVYSKVKDYNSVTNWTLSTAENTVHKAVEIGKPYAVPVVCHLKEPIEKVDSLICTGLDYIEEKVPAVKLPPGEMFLQMYTGTKDYVTNTVGTGVETAKHMVEPTVESCKKIVEPAVESAKQIMEPAVEAAKHYIEPAVETAKHYIDPALVKANAIKDYGVQQVEKILHPHSENGGLYFKSELSFLEGDVTCFKNEDLFFMLRVELHFSMPLLLASSLIGFLRNDVGELAVNVKGICCKFEMDSLCCK